MNIKHIALTATLLLTLPFLMGANSPLERKIVLFKADAVPEIQEVILKKHHAQKIHNLPLINGQSILIAENVAKVLAQEKNVLMVENDLRVNASPVIKKRKTGQTEPDPEPQVLPWGIERIDAQDAWTQTTGSEIKVAVLDTGIDVSHPDISQNLAGGISFVKNSRDYDDDSGHGTHVAGIIAAQNNLQGVVGVGPDIDLYAVKVLNKKGSGYISDIINGIQWCCDNNIQVINMSFGTSQYSQAFADAVKAAYNQNIVLVAAAGNTFGGDVDFPARFPEVIAVSAADSSNNLASFSAVGTEVDFAAPGVDIYSTSKSSTYDTFSGTSMAAPHVSGTAALILNTKIGDKNGDGIISPEEVKMRLQETAEDLGSPGTDDYFGAGLINSYQAVHWENRANKKN